MRLTHWGKKKTNIKGGYFLQEDVGLFDPAFFGLSADMTAVSQIFSETTLDTSSLAIAFCSLRRTGFGPANKNVSGTHL